MASELSATAAASPPVPRHSVSPPAGPAPDQAAAREVREAGVRQQAAARETREAEVEEQRARARVAEARTEKQRADLQVQEALAEQQRAAAAAQGRGRTVNTVA